MSQLLTQLFAQLVLNVIPDPGLVISKHFTRNAEFTDPTVGLEDPDPGP